MLVCTKAIGENPYRRIWLIGLSKSMHMDGNNVSCSESEVNIVQCCVSCWLESALSK